MQLSLRAPKKFRQNDSSYLFQAFLDECDQACRGVYDKEFEPTEASEISRPSISNSSDDDDVCGQNETEASKLSLSGILNLEFEADEDPVAGNLPRSGLQTLTNISIYKAYCAHTNFV